jgi:hypothetical protein
MWQQQISKEKRNNTWMQRRKLGTSSHRHDSMRTADMLRRSGSTVQKQVAATIGNVDSDWNEDRRLQIKSSHEKGSSIALRSMKSRMRSWRRDEKGGRRQRADGGHPRELISLLPGELQRNKLDLTLGSVYHVRNNRWLDWLMNNSPQGVTYIDEPHD